MDTKKSKVIKALEEKDYLEALKIAKSFHIELTKKENSIVRRAYEMHWNPRFYEALGFDREKEFNKGVDVLKRVYNVK